MNNIYTFNFMIISILLSKFTVHSVIFDVHSYIQHSF